MSTRRGPTDTVVNETLRVKSIATKVRATDVYQSEEDGVTNSYPNTRKLADSEITSFFKDREAGFSLPVGAKSIEVVVLVEMKTRKSEIDQGLADQFQVQVIRSEKLPDQFSIVVSKDLSNDAWKYVKQNAAGIAIAYRELSTQ